MNTTIHPRLVFAKLLRKIQPPNRDLARAKVRVGAIKTRLSQSFQVADARIMGSHARDTAIAEHSDVDLFVLLKRSEARWGQSDMSSATLLDKFRRDLDQRYVNTKVGRDGQAIVVHFEKGDAHLDVVPGVFRRFDNGPIYAIPDGAGGWLETSPLGHNQFFRRANTRSEGRLARTARLLKWWKYCRSPAVPVSSFYLDMMLTTSKICDHSNSYAKSIALALSYLADRHGKTLTDPTNLSGQISACRSDSQLERFIQTVESSARNARLALICEWAGDHQKAVSLWERVFNGNIP